MHSIPLNISLRFHLFIGAIVSIWLVLFLILIAPFDTSELSFKIRLLILPPYGLICFLGYLLVIPIQNKIFSRTKNWSVLSEALVIVLFNLLVLFGSYWYYKTDIINGAYSFSKFTFQVYYPIFFILLPIIVFGRWFLTKKAATANVDEVILKGENRYDFLKVKTADLVCVSSADNYVEVTYISNKSLKKKLLRNTLKSVELEHPNLLRTHRSHLINPIHLKEWKDSNTIMLNEIEIPVSKNYKQGIMQLENSPLKT